MTTTPSPPDAAEVLLNGKVVGEVYWSMSDEPLINVIVKPVAMPLIEEWATGMGGVFREEHWDE